MQPGCLPGEMRLTKTFNDLVKNDIKHVEALMRTQGDGVHPDLSAALKVLIEAGGKRIRPVVTLLTGQMLGADNGQLITLSAAIELLHTATLVHDDLIDSSLLRRGVPTLNAQWSPGATVLTGDFIFARAAKLAADTGSVELMRVFSQTLSTIVNGEITQLFTGRCLANRDDYYSRIYAKTASLFETSAMTPALLSPVERSIVEHMRAYGYGIGMAFQIVDDVLDFTGKQATVGKPVGSDLRQGIVTLPVIYYAENNPDDPGACALKEGRCLDDREVERIIEAVANSSAIRQSLDEACRFVREGLEHLREAPAGIERQALEDLGDYIVERQL